MASAPDETIDPRVARTREVVLAAAVDVLVNSGFDRVSIDAIAERSGVARSTIYRNWPDRSELLTQAFQQVHRGPGDRLESSGDLRTDLEALARRLVEKLTSEEWARTVPSLVGAAVHGGQFRELAASFCQERQDEAGRLFQAASERGEVGRPDQLDSARERFAAPFFFRRLVSQQALDDDFIAGQVEATMFQLGAVDGRPHSTNAP